MNTWSVLLIIKFLIPSLYGASAFEDLVREGKVQNLESFSSFAENARADNSLQIVGRSLQRAHAGMDAPRELISAGQGEFPKILAGYAPKVDEMEVISWDPQVRRYKFFVVEGLTSRPTPHVRKANMKVCQGCHQNQAGIFPRAPWSETAFNPRMVRKAGLYQIAVPFYDKSIRSSNQAVQTAKFCETACGDNQECKVRLLTLALSISVNFNNSEDRKERSQEEAIKLLLRKVDLSYPSSVIPDRDPSLFEEEGGLATLHRFDPDNLHDLLKSNKLHYEAMKKHRDNPFYLNYVDDLASMSASRFSLEREVRFKAGLGHHETPADPSVPRPRTPFADPSDPFASFQLRRLLPEACFGLTEEDQEEARDLTQEPENLLNSRALRSLVNNSWPPQRDEVLGALKRTRIELNLEENCL